MNVLIIPEDFRKDQHIVLPIVQRMLREVGKPNANVRVCLDPLMGGVSQAMKWERIREVLVRYRGMVQVFLLLVNRDGNAGRRTASIIWNNRPPRCWRQEGHCSPKMPGKKSKFGRWRDKTCRLHGNGRRFAPRCIRRRSTSNPWQNDADSPTNQAREERPWAQKRRATMLAFGHAVSKMSRHLNCG